MNKFKFYFILSLTTVLLFSCSKNDNSIIVAPLRDYQEEFTAENVMIEEYLKTNYITVTQDPGDQTDQDVVFAKIDADQSSIYSYLGNSGYPKLLTREVQLHGITYSMYYLVLREGIGESPSNVDNVLVSYSGRYLSESTPSDLTTLSATFFEEIKYPQSMSNLYSGVIRGRGELMPKFKVGTATEGMNGEVQYNDFGSGILFIPSGLAYYSAGADIIPSYAPVIFSIKLYALQRLDQDGDSVLSYKEDLNNDGYAYSYLNKTTYPITPTNFDDTDGDGIPNFLDTDDDGDGFSTLVEIAAGSDYLDKNSVPKK
ncbi:FKBP-type peptidyl-prolyl cis-trans isomerase [Flavobacterium sp. 7A]|uniref:FKBP-type peptidyl-prolyl cis-trans isomerase n=1 Tax=Flavobacterium sp. 7A TaxID=2940571 RepID=UPI0022263D36|nr:FKBP-type peptidylprolyl isomerase [Flavobacterium sp. 7A]MCW2121027.1 hypothetical protein [Flavobacterium sp. 7A]